MRIKTCALAIGAMTQAALAQELPSIPSNFDKTPWIHGGTNPLPSAGTAVNEPGAFRFICTPSHEAYADPIVMPGMPGMSHLHTFFGNTRADANSTYESLRTTGDGTCAGGPLNRSAYWLPSMMNGRGKVVRPDMYAVYYKAVPGKTRLPPRGLRMVFGWHADPKLASWHDWACEDGSKGGSQTIAQAGCPAGLRIGGRLATRECWDGKNLDHPDHRSHMATKVWDNGASGVPWPGPCPPTHPIEIPQFTIAAWFQHGGPAELAQWHLSSDRMAGMTQYPGGATLHSDWFGAWDDDIMRAWHAGCISKRLNCSDGQIDHGVQMARPPGLAWVANPRYIDPPPQQPVAPPPPPPVPNKQPTAVYTATALSVVKNAVPANVGKLVTSDPEGDPILITTSGDNGGAFWKNSDGVIGFAPWGDYVGEASTNYSVTDNKSAPVTGRITIRVEDPAPTPTPAPTPAPAPVPIPSTPEPVIVSSLSFKVEENRVLRYGLPADRKWEILPASGTTSADAARFKLSADGRSLEFQGGSMDYEKPSSAAGNNTYKVVLRGTNAAGTHTDTLNTIVYVLNQKGK
jgi:hypothetical protein